MIDIVKNLNTKPEKVNQRTAQSATDGAAKMMQEKAGSQGRTGPSGKINVMANLGVQQQEQQAESNINQAVKQNQQQFQQQERLQEEQDLMGRRWSEEELKTQQIYDQQVTALLENFRENSQNINMQRDNVTTQALAQTMRLSDQAYVDKLNLIMEENLLKRGISEAELTQKLAYGEELEAISNQLDHQAEFEKERIDYEFIQSREALEEAFKQGKALTESRRREDQWNAFSNTVQAGIGTSQSISQSNIDADNLSRQQFEDQRSGYTDWKNNQRSQ